MSQEATRISAPYAYMIDDYAENFEALSDLLDAIKDDFLHLDSLEVAAEPFRELFGKIPASRMGDIYHILRKNAEKEGAQVSDIFDELIENHGMQDWVATAIYSIHKYLMRKPRVPILMNSLLVSVVSTFEVHVANLVSQYFRDAPQALNRSDLRTSEKEFSLADIQSAQSVDDVIDMAISRRVEKLLFGSLKDWSNFFETNMGIKFEDLSINWNFVQEAVQRRHIIIHNGGYVSSRYVSLTKGLSSGVEVLDPRSLARCDEAYLSRVLDEFLALGILLAASVAMKMKVQGKSTIVHSIHDLSYEMLKRGRWVFCVHACRFGEKISEEEDMRVLFKVNRLIAQKNKGDVEPAIREAAEWDVSAAELRFKLAKMILADDSADPYPVLAKLIERKEVGLEDLLNWPLLEGVRGDRRFPWVVLYAQQKSGKSKNQGDYFFTSSKSQVVHILGCSRVGEGHTSIPVSSLFTGDFRPCVFCTSSSDEGFSVRELSS